MRVFPQTVTWPTAEPVTLEQLRAEVRADDGADDATLMGSLMAARDLVEGMAGRRLVPRTVRAVFEAWPVGAPIEIAVPVTSVDALTYTDATGTVVPWAAGQWIARTTVGITRVRPASGAYWPTLGPDPVITLDATHGYTQIPEGLVKAVLLAAAHFHLNREATVGGSVPAEIALGVRALIAPHKWTRFA